MQQELQGCIPSDGESWIIIIDMSKIQKQLHTFTRLHYALPPNHHGNYNPSSKMVEDQLPVTQHFPPRSGSMCDNERRISTLVSRLGASHLIFTSPVQSHLITYRQLGRFLTRQFLGTSLARSTINANAGPKLPSL